MRNIFLFTTFFVSLVVSAQDGTLDLSFNTGIGPNSIIRKLLLQPDDKIIVFGEFVSYDNVPRRHIARINSDGTLDTSFISNINTNSGVFISDAILQSDGKIIISERIGQNLNYKISRLNSNGSVDLNFNIGIATGGIYSLGLQSDGKIIISGHFTGFNGNSITNLARLNSNGSFDSTFLPEVDVNIFYPSTSGHALLIQPDDKIIINTKENGVIKLARLNPNGSLDINFNAPDETYANKFLLLPDGKIVFSREIDFAFPITNSLYQLSRLNTDGSADVTFGSIFLDEMEDNINSIALQSDGKILIGGDFNFNTSNAKFLARLNTNGTLDASFQTGTGPNHRVLDIVFKPYGRVVISGVFTKYDDIPRNYIAQLISDSELVTNEFESKTINFNPNPVKDILYIDSPDTILVKEYEIYDLQGKRVIGDQLNNNSINVSNLSNGVYMLKINTANGFFLSKFLKE